MQWVPCFLLAVSLGSLASGVLGLSRADPTRGGVSRWSSAPTPAGHQPEPHQGQQRCWMASRWPGPRPTGAGGLPTLRDDVWGAGTGGGRGPPSVTQSGLSVSVHSLQSEARVGPRVFPSFCQASQLSDPHPTSTRMSGVPNAGVCLAPCVPGALSLLHRCGCAQRACGPQILWAAARPLQQEECVGVPLLFTAASQSRCERQASLGPAPGSRQELRAGPDVETTIRAAPPTPAPCLRSHHPFAASGDFVVRLPGPRPLAVPRACSSGSVPSSPLSWFLSWEMVFGE